MSAILPGKRAEIYHRVLIGAIAFEGQEKLEDKPFKFTVSIGRFALSEDVYEAKTQ